MPPSHDSTVPDQATRLARLGEAMDAWLQFCAAGDGDREQFLRRHDHLRDVLEPMLQEHDGTEVPPAPTPRVLGPGQVLGDYLLHREVGRGGMGVVYEAEQRSLRRRVALKVLSAHLTLAPQSIERFRREAAAAARLRHPAIVPIHEVGESDGCHFYSMEFVDGRPLHELVHQERLGVRRDCSRAAEAAELVARLGDALQHAHDHGLVHRDVKPHNVMIGTDGSVRLMDFGLAKEFGSATRSATVDFLGTPQYCSPEQVTGAARIGPSSDVFSLGIVLYELLARRRPFDGETARIVLRNIEVGAFPPLRQVAPEVPHDLQTICHKALGPRPQDRYLSAGAFAADLRRFLRLEPILAVPPGPVTRSLKWVRRHRLGVALGAIAAVAIVGAPIAYAWHLHHNRTVILRERAVLDRAEDLGFQSIEQTLTLLREQLDLLPEPGATHIARLHAVVALCDSFVAMRQDEPRRQTRVAAALGEIAGIQAQMRQFDAAAAACGRAKALLAGSTSATLQYGRILERELQIRQLAAPGTGDAEFRMAMTHWREALAANADDVELRHACARTLLLRARALAQRPDRRRHAEPLLAQITDVLGSEVAGTDLRTRTLLARRDAALGGLLLAAHRTEDALTQLRAVAAVMDTLPGDPTLGAERALVDAGIGTALHRLGRGDEAAKLLGATIANSTAQLRLFPTSASLHLALLQTRTALADHLFVSGDVQGATTVLRQAAAADATRPATATLQPDEQAALAALDRQLATCLTMSDDRADHAEASDLLRRACDRMQDLVDEVPGHLEFQVDLGLVHHTLAGLAIEHQDHQVAAHHAELAVAAQRAVLAVTPNDARVRSLLGAHQAHLAWARAASGDGAAATEAAAEALRHGPGQVTTLRLAARAAVRAMSLAANATGPSTAEADAVVEVRAQLAIALLRQILILDRDEARRLLDNRAFSGLGERADAQALRRELDQPR
ncbi:MAG: serine/threonine protein kinase [Planctomycetes bacterium]|nr:serine/threonine protein kinase [Planctomycetota bacterium]